MNSRTDKKSTRPAVVSPDRVRETCVRLEKEAESSGYHLNPDKEVTRGLVEGLLNNEQRYGYWNCPCRLAAGDKAKDLDIICPCDYRDADLTEFGTCYCTLYVSDEVIKGTKQIRPIPERRSVKAAKHAKPVSSAARRAALPLPVWRCKVCGYLCGREAPPGTCPICKAGSDRFERFMG